MHKAIAAEAADSSESDSNGSDFEVGDGQDNDEEFMGGQVTDKIATARTNNVEGEEEEKKGGAAATHNDDNDSDSFATSSFRSDFSSV